MRPWNDVKAIRTHPIASLYPEVTGYPARAEMVLVIDLAIAEWRIVCCTGIRHRAGVAVSTFHRVQFSK